MAERNGQAVIFGEVLFDRFPDGSVVLGGAPFNVAWHLQALGQSPLFISRIGNDSLGRSISEAMRAWNMNTAGLQLDTEHPTGSVEVRIEQGEPRYEMLAGSAYDYISAPETLPSASLIYHGTLALRNRCSAEALETLKRGFDGTLFLDVNLRPPWWQAQQLTQLLRDAHWVKLNEHELQALAPDEQPLEDKARLFLQQYAIELLIVTRGAQGALAFGADGRQAEVHPPNSTTVVDTVGAGDAFTSVTIAGLLQGWPLQQILERAQHFASAVVGVRGATIQDREFYKPFLQRWELLSQ
jgi:fructokinase